MIIATEDTVSEVVVRKLVAEIRPDLEISVAIGNRGKGYLKSRARELNRSGRSMPVFLLLDLDHRNVCPGEVIQSWMHGTIERNMLCRIAVMEVESWLLAHRSELAAYLGVSASRIPRDTDAIDKPKEFLVNLARRSRKSNVRYEFVPPPGSTAIVGPAYNLQLAAFIRASWSPQEAAKSSASLLRAIDRLAAAF